MAARPDAQPASLFHVMLVLASTQQKSIGASDHEFNRNAFSIKRCKC
jgi:hypothetical protein